MKWAFIFLKIGGGKAVSYNHVHISLQHFICHLSCRFCRIGIISVYHKIALCIYFLEHSSYYIAFSLVIFMTDNCTGFRCDFGSSVCRIVVIHIDHCFRQYSLKICHYFFDCFPLVITGNQYCYFIHNFSCNLIIIFRLGMRYFSC